MGETLKMGGKTLKMGRKTLIAPPLQTYKFMSDMNRWAEEYSI